jgi:RNA-directed DNA polymerase
MMLLDQHLPFLARQLPDALLAHASCVDGTRRSAFRGIDRYVYERVRDFLARRHKVAGRGTKRFSCEVVYGERGLLRLERLPLAAPSRALR